MLNIQKYKTVKERTAACADFLIKHKEYSDIPYIEAAMIWLDLEAEEEKPLPCPGCGNTEMYKHDEIQDPKTYIVCPNCGYRSPWEMNIENAVRRHNEIARAVMESDKNEEANNVR